MIHPNQMAIDYIFEKFSTAFFTGETTILNQKIKRLNQLENHRFLNPTDDEIKKHELKIQALKEEIRF